MIKHGCCATNLEIMDKVLNFWNLHHGPKLLFICLSV